MAESEDQGGANFDERDDEATIESGGLIGNILSHSMKSEIVGKSGIEFDLQKLPEENQRIFDAALRTLLNGYDMLCKLFALSRN